MTSVFSASYARWASALALVVLLAAPLAPESHAQERPFVQGVQTAPPGAQAVLAAVEKALADGKAEALTEHFAERIELTVPGSSKLYSRAQATYVLAELVRRLPPGRVALQAPSASSGQWLAQGTYLAADATDALRLYVRLRADASGTWFVRELRLYARP